jgi:hypothetical protein
MAWYRAAAMAFLLHGAVLVLFMFTFKGHASMYKIDLIFLGSILRPQEVASYDRRLPSGPGDVRNLQLPADPGTRLLLWSRGIAIDKPDFFKNVLFSLNEDAFRFVGKRVELDENKAEPHHMDADIPQPVPVRMRLERP